MQGVSRREMGQLAGAAVLGTALPGLVSAAEHPLLTPQQQLADLRLARLVLEESHAGLFWFITRAAFERAWTRLTRSAAAPCSKAAFQVRLSRVIGHLHHGHTTLEDTFRDGAYRLRRLRSGERYFPLHLRVIGQRLFVAQDLSAAGTIPAGSELVAVDGQHAGRLLAQMEGLIGSDGDAAGFARYQIGTEWRFQDLLALLQGPRAHHSVRYRTAGKALRASIAAATPEEIEQRHLERRGERVDSYEPAVSHTRRGRTAVLRVASFYEGLLPRGSAGFAAEFAAFFAGLAADLPLRLVLDLRGNAGGNTDYAPLLYSYLADRPFRLAGPTVLQSASLSTIRMAQDPSAEVLAFAEDPALFVERDPRYGWVLKGEFDELRTRTYAPQAQAYTGALTVLIDGGSFSATGVLVDLIHQFHRRAGRAVEFAGEPPGFAARSVWASGGQSLVVPLPASGLRLTVPLLGSRQYLGEAGGAALPDRLLIPTAQDVLTRHDGVLERAVLGSA